MKKKNLAFLPLLVPLSVASPIWACGDNPNPGNPDGSPINIEANPTFNNEFSPSISNEFKPSIDLKANPMSKSESESKSKSKSSAKSKSELNLVSTPVAEALITLIQNSARIPMTLNPHEISYPRIVPYYGPHNPGYRFRSVEDILLYGNKFYLSELQWDVDDEVLESNSLIRIRNKQALRQVITIIFKDKRERIPGMRRCGFVGAIAVNGHSSLDAFQLLCLAANHMGASVVHITGQGANLFNVSSSWGIGPNVSAGGVSPGGNSSWLVSGGTGYSKATAGPDADPWIQAIALEPLVK